MEQEVISNLIIDGPEKVNIVLDASRIDLFETCPRRYDFRYNLNKALPIMQKAKALDLGGLAHNGLEVYYRELAKGIHFKERLEACLMKVREVSSDAMKSNSEPQEVENLLRALEVNLDHWRVEDENELEVLAVEEPFVYTAFEDDLIRIIISGKIDLLVNIIGLGGRSSYKRVPFDHKTYSRDSMVLRKSNQFINYASAVNSNYLIVNRIGLQMSGTPEDRMRRLPLSYDPMYIAEWKANLVKMLLQEYIPCVTDGYWPDKPTSCNKFNRLCEYYEVCDTSGNLDDKLRKLNNHYVDAEVWDVTRDM